MRPQSAKYPSSNRQIDMRPPMPALRPKMANNYIDGEDPYSQLNNRSTSQKGGMMRPQSSYNQSQNILLKINQGEKPKMNFLNSHQEVEKLQEDMRQLKLKVNELREENTKIKTKNMILEKEKQKYERAIQDIQMHGINNNRLISKLGQDANMVFTMKQSIKELRSGLEQKEEEIYKIKKAVKYTKIQEVEMEKKAYADELLRLRGIIEQLLEFRQQYELGSLQQGKMQTQIIEQNNMLVQMQEANNELAQTAQELEYQNAQLSEMIEQNPDSKKSEMQMQSLKQVISLRDQEISKLKNQVELLEKKDSSKSKIQRPQSGNSNHPQQQQLLNQVSYLKQELQNREQENEQLRQDMTEIEYYLQANGLIKSQASSTNQLDVIQRPKSLSDIHSKAFMSNSEYHDRQPQMDQEDGFTKQKKKVGGIKKPSKVMDIETSQLSSPQNHEVDLDHLDYMNNHPEDQYQEQFEDERAYSQQIEAEGEEDAQYIIEDQLQEESNYEQDQFEEVGENSPRQPSVIDSYPAQRSVVASSVHKNSVHESSMRQPSVHESSMHTIVQSSIHQSAKVQSSSHIPTAQPPTSLRRPSYGQSQTAIVENKGENSFDRKSDSKIKSHQIITSSEHQRHLRSLKHLEQSTIKKSNASDYQMDLDSAKVDEYLSREELYQQSMSLQNEEMDYDQISDGPVHY